MPDVEAEPTPDIPQINRLRPTGGVISAERAQRLVLFLLALWTGLSGLALTLFQDASGATIAGGLGGGQGHAAQRLVGVHLLVLAPVYALIAWYPKRYRLLLWVPYAAQGGVVITTLYDIMRGYRTFTDGALPLFVAVIFLALLLYVTFADRPPEEFLPGIPRKQLPEATESPPSSNSSPNEPPPTPA